MGVDMIERTNPNGSVQAVFPVYDAHCNNVATLSRNGSGGFSLGDRRTYDAWGVVRAQQSGGDPKLRYCASLGHRQDDESGLVYMRARYYEPGSGRFVSEDDAAAGRNWYVYCQNDPVNRVDNDGHMSDPVSVMETILNALLKKRLSTWSRASIDRWLDAFDARLDETIGRLGEQAEADFDKAQSLESKGFNDPGENEMKDQMAALARASGERNLGLIGKANVLKGFIRIVRELAEMDAGDD